MVTHEMDDWAGTYACPSRDAIAPWSNAIPRAAGWRGPVRALRAFQTELPLCPACPCRGRRMKPDPAAKGESEPDPRVCLGHGRGTSTGRWRAGRPRGTFARIAR